MLIVEDFEIAGETINVLHIDDEEHVLNLTKKFLEAISEAYIRVDSLCDPEQAIEKLREKKYDIIVCDYQMPEMNGLELLNQLREQNQTIPFIMFTGRGREEVAIKALNLGANYYIKKEGDPKTQYTELEHIIRMVVNHKRVENALREKDALYRAVVETMKDGVGILDRNGIIIYANKRTLEMIGHTKDEFVGHPVSDFLDEVNQKRLNAQLFFREEGIIEPYELTWIKKDGGNLNTFVWPKPLFNKDGTIKGFFAVVTDITEHSWMKKNLEKQWEELRDFAHFIAHDLGNSLMTIEGYIQLYEIEQDNSYIEKIRKQIIYIKNQFKKSLDLIKAGWTVEKTDKVNLNQLVETVADAALPNHIVFSHDTLPTVLCDREKIVQAFKNLIENAVIHGNPTKIEIKLKLLDKGFLILVVNDGKMISPEDVEKVFTHGYSTKSGHSGLGLTIVKKIMEAHDWKISLQSTAKTTTFQIFIPKNET